MLKRNEKKQHDQAYALAQSEWLLPTTTGTLEPENLEKTYNLTQRNLRPLLSTSVQKKQFDLKFEKLGPYTIDYSRNGRHMLLAGGKGHLGTFDWKDGVMGCELQLQETIRDAKYKYTIIYFTLITPCKMASQSNTLCSSTKKVGLHLRQTRT